MAQKNRFATEIKTKDQIDLQLTQELTEVKIDFMYDILIVNAQIPGRNPSIDKTLTDSHSVNLFAPNFELNQLIAEIVLELNPISPPNLPEFERFYPLYFQKFYGGQKMIDQKMSLLKRVKPTPADLEEWLSNLRALAIILEKFHGEKGQAYLREKFLNRYIKALAQHYLRIDLSVIKDSNERRYIDGLSSSYFDYNVRQKIYAVFARMDRGEKDQAINEICLPQVSITKLYFSALNLKFPNPADLLDLLIYKDNPKVQ